MKATLMTIPANCTINDVHKRIHRAFSDPNDANAVCPRYTYIGADVVQVFSKYGPIDSSKVEMTYDVSLPTGDITITSDIAAFRKVNGRRLSYPAGEVATRVKERIERALQKYGLPVNEFRWKFEGVISDPEHKCTLPHGKVTVRTHCDDASVLETLCINGIGALRYLGLGAVLIKPANA